MTLSKTLLELAQEAFLRGGIRTELWQDKNRIDLASAEKVLDLKNGTVLVGPERRPFPLQVLASYPLKRQELMWAWVNNSKRIPPNVTVFASMLADIGAKFEIPELTQPIVACTPDELTTLGLIAAEVIRAEAFFLTQIDETLVACLIGEPEDLDTSLIRPSHIARAISRAPVLPSLSLSRAVQDAVEKVCGWKWRMEGDSLRVQTKSGEEAVFKLGDRVEVQLKSSQSDPKKTGIAEDITAHEEPAASENSPGSEASAQKRARVKSDRLHDEGDELRVSREFEKAIDKFKEAVAVDPTYEWAHLGLASVYEDLDDSRKALDVLTAALTTARTPRILKKMGDLHDNLDEPDAAASCLREAVSLDPEYSAAHALLGYVLLNQNKLNEALEAVEKALGADDKNDFAMVLKGRVVEQRGNTSDALKYVKRARAMANENGRGDKWRTDLVRLEKKLRQQNKWTSLPTIEEMKEFLDRSVCGQERAKTQLCTAIYNHYVSVAHQEEDAVNTDLGRFNALIFGPSGCGKTYMIELLTKKLGVPMTIVSATSLVQVGYVGKKVDSIIEDLLAAADYNVAKAERGIVFIDEIDKVRKHAGESNDVAGEGVQNSLLQMLEGKEYRIETKNADYTVHSGKILFIAAGAFDGISKITAMRLSNQHRSLGFGGHLVTTQGEGDESALLDKVSIEDLEEYGFIPQLTGRFSSITNLRVLTREDLRKILTAMDNSVLEKQKKLFALHGIELRFEPDALEAVLDKTNSARTGARGLRAALQSALHTVGWRVSELAKSNVREVVITRGAVLSQEDPIFVKGAGESAVSSAIGAIRANAFAKLTN